MLRSCLVHFYSGEGEHLHCSVPDEGGADGWHPLLW